MDLDEVNMMARIDLDENCVIWGAKCPYVRGRRRHHFLACFLGKFWLIHIHLHSRSLMDGDQNDTIFPSTFYVNPNGSYMHPHAHTLCCVVVSLFQSTQFMCTSIWIFLMIMSSLFFILILANCLLYVATSFHKLIKKSIKFQKM